MLLTGAGPLARSGSGVGPPTVTPVMTGATTAGTDQQTITGPSFGSPFSTRMVIIVLSGRAGGAGTTSAAIDGVTANIAAEQNETTDFSEALIIYAVVPTGTCGNVVINTSGSNFGLALNYVLYTADTSQMQSTTPVTGGNNTTSNVNSIAATYSPLANAAVVGAFGLGQSNQASIAVSDGTNSYTLDGGSSFVSGAQFHSTAWAAAARR
jgi:hypothetical protein